MNHTTIQHKALLILLAIVTIGFVYILLPFYGAIFWGIVLAILFAPLHDRVLAFTKDRRNLAALVTLLLFLVVVFIPLTFIVASLVKEGAGVYEKIKTGQIDFGLYLHNAIASLPDWVSGLLSRFGITDISTLKDSLTVAVKEGSQFIATHVFSIGQVTAGFAISIGIMLYLFFFLLRDGVELNAKIREAAPFKKSHKQQLFDTFTTVIRATVKGNIIVAASQGALGGAMFWFLGIQGALFWGVVMAFMSLIPAVGAGLIWVPVALYFLLTGALWQGITLILYGVFVIGLVDNILRPILVGKDTQMPDYVVLFSTLGGIAIFGLNGFVIGPVIAALFIAVWELFVSERDAAAYSPK